MEQNRLCVGGVIILIIINIYTNICIWVLLRICLLLWLLISNELSVILQVNK